LKKKYSIEEAEEVIPQLKPVIKNIRDKAREYSKCLLDATQLVLNFRENPYDKDGVLDRTIAVRKELKNLFSNLENFGVILRDIDRGTLDFPAEVDGEEIFLCWRALEEDNIRYWHYPAEPCIMRKPLKKT
jgi:hypothetical protein